MIKRQCAVFQGGGIKVLSFIGALKRFEQEGIKFNAVAGTSAGAMIAALYAVGFTADELKKRFIDNSLPDVFDGGKRDLHIIEKIFQKNLFLQILRYFKSVCRIYKKLKKDLGLCSTEQIGVWLEKLLNEKQHSISDLAGKITFGSVYEKRGVELYILAANISRGRIVLFSKANYPDKKVAAAVRASASIPLIFSPYRDDGDLLVDGSLMSSFPADIYGNNVNTDVYGFRFEHPEKFKEVKTLKDCFEMICNAILSATTELSIQACSRIKLINIPTPPHSPLDSDLDLMAKEKLYWDGFAAADRYFLKENPSKTIKQVLNLIHMQVSNFPRLQSSPLPIYRVNLMRPQNNWLKITESVGMDREEDKDKVIALNIEENQGCASKAYTEKIPVVADLSKENNVSDYHLDATSIALVSPKLSSILSFPIRATDCSNPPLGVLNIDSEAQIINTPFQEEQFILTISEYCKTIKQIIDGGKDNEN